AEDCIRDRNVTGVQTCALPIFGGGSKNEMLNQLIADTTGKLVVAGPSEATAIGNIAAQLIALKKIKNTGEARSIISESFDLMTRSEERRVGKECKSRRV